MCQLTIRTRARRGWRGLGQIKCVKIERGYVLGALINCLPKALRDAAGGAMATNGLLTAPCPSLTDLAESSPEPSPARIDVRC